MKTSTVSSTLLRSDLLRVRIVTLTFLLLSGLIVSAQKKKADSTIVSGDSLEIISEKQIKEIEMYTERFNPRKALLYAAVLPGAGQAYNKKYWKLPLVYGGFVGGALMISFNQTQYIKAKRLLFNKLAAGTTSTTTTTTSTGLSEDQLRNAANRYRRDRDFWCILGVVWYGLQMVDAHVDAHLKEFDVNPQLKVRLEPTMDNDTMTGRNAGISLKLKF